MVHGPIIVHTRCGSFIHSNILIHTEDLHGQTGTDQAHERKDPAAHKHAVALETLEGAALRPATR